jgi:hypothetical protein
MRSNSLNSSDEAFAGCLVVLYMLTPKDYTSAAMSSEWTLFFAVGAVVAGGLAAWNYFSPGSKLRRRRKKSHSRIEATAHRPMVKCSVRPRKK